MENVLASRIQLNQDNQILGEIILLECAELNTLINRLLYPEKNKTEPGVSIKVEWELVHVCLDYFPLVKINIFFFLEK